MKNNSLKTVCATVFLIANINYLIKATKGFILENGLKIPSFMVEKHATAEAPNDWMHCSYS